MKRAEGGGGGGRGGVVSLDELIGWLVARFGLVMKARVPGSEGCVGNEMVRVVQSNRKERNNDSLYIYIYM